MFSVFIFSKVGKSLLKVVILLLTVWLFISGLVSNSSEELLVLGVIFNSSVLVFWLFKLLLLLRLKISSEFLLSSLLGLASSTPKTSVKFPVILFKTLASSSSFFLV